METMKSTLPFYGELYTCLLLDAARMCNCESIELERDLQKFRNSLVSGGIDFLTKILPSHGKALDRALSSGTPLVLQARKRSATDHRPQFLWSLWKGVFDGDCNLLQEPSITHIRVLRQILYLSYKLNLPYDETTTQKVIDSFTTIEEELRVKPESDFDRPIVILARRLIGRLVCNFDYRGIKPRHGPGAVSTGEKHHRKMTFSRLYHEIERIYPFTEYYLPASDDFDHLKLRSLQPLAAGTAKVVLVPKDSRGPRLISCEPLEYQWLQQGVGRKLMSFLEAHPWTAGYVNFTDQTVNQKLALEGSRNGSLCTLDMKDASDRVSIALVERVFGNTALLEALMALRSFGRASPMEECLLYSSMHPWVQPFASLWKHWCSGPLLSVPLYIHTRFHGVEP